MGENSQKGRVNYALVHGLIFGLVVTPIKNRVIVWNLFKANEADLSILLTDFLWIFIGATIGYYF